MSDLFLTSDYSLTLPSGGPTFGVHRLLPIPAPKFGTYNNQANAHRTYADTPKKLPF